jgi:hypothetical protein
LFAKGENMKNNENIIKIKSTRSVWSLIIVFALATVFSAFEVAMCVTTPSAYYFYYWGGIFFACIAATALFVEFSKRRIEIDLENEIIFCKRLFVKKESIRVNDVKEVLNVENKFAWNLKLISSEGGNSFKIPKDILSDNSIPLKNFSDFITKKNARAGKCDATLLKSDPKLQKKNSTFIKIASAIICGPIIAIYAFLFVVEMSGRPEFPVRYTEFYVYPIFWILLVSGLLFISMMLSKKKHFQFVDFGAVMIAMMFIPSALCCLLLTPEDCYVSATRDFENYHEVKADKIDYFPDEIEGGEVVAFSYYYKYYWDSVHEVCLEVKYDDEEFDRIYSQYEDKRESYFGGGLEEVSFSGVYENLELSDDGTKISYADIELMIFDKTNNTVIYYYLQSTDFLDIEWCYLVERFDIDVKDYSEYIEESKETAN